MLPSMPILFTRESQDAFGNKIEPSTSFFKPTSVVKPAIKTEDVSRKILEKGQTDIQNKPTGQKLGEEIKKNDAVEVKTKVEDNPIEAALVRCYYTKVQSKFSSYASLPTNKFRQFQEALKTFDPNKETPVDLFKKIEQIFGDEHKDLVEEFLLFLKPGQAVEVGKFMDHFMLVQITGFIKLLNTTFSRKPTVLRKIIRAISTGVNTGSREEMKTRILPHLRSSPRLMQMFQSLFPDTRPPDAVYEGSTDTINEGFLTDDQEYDVWEFAEDKHKRKPSGKEGLHSEYLHGRVFIQHGRMLRTACVTYPYSKEPYRSHARRLAPGSLSPSDTDRERGSPKKNNKTVDKIPPKRTRKQLKSPTKNVKDFNDNTKKECLTNTLIKIKGKTHKGKILKKDETQKKKVDNKNTKGVDKTEAKVEKNWTRDEDKTMLEILKGESGTEEVFERIRAVLPHRTIAEIKQRLHHVLNLLQEMAVNIT